MRFQPRVERDNPALVVPSKARKVRIHHLLVPGGMPENTGVNRRQILPEPVRGMGGQLEQQCRRVLR